MVEKIDLEQIGRCQRYQQKCKPYAFTEQGIYMLKTVLMGDLAMKQSIAHKWFMPNIRLGYDLFDDFYANPPLALLRHGSNYPYF